MRTRVSQLSSDEPLRTRLTNGVTNLVVAPAGTGVGAAAVVIAASDTANTSRLFMSVNNSAASIVTDAVGAGTNLPLAVVVGGVTRMYITTAGSMLATQEFGVGVAGTNTSAAGITIGSNPSHLTYAMLTNATVTNTGSAGIAINDYPAASVTAFYEALQIATTFAAGTYTTNAYAGIHIYAPTRGSGQTIGTENGIIVESLNGSSVNYGIIVYAQSGATTNIGLMVNGGTVASSPAILLGDRAGTIAARGSSGGFYYVFQMASDDVNCFYSGPGSTGLAFVNYQNNTRIAVLSNTGDLQINGTMTVGNNLRVNFNTIYLYSDLTRKFYANGGGASASHSFEFTAGGYAPCVASAFNVGSSLASKADVRKIESALDVVMHPSLEGVSFRRVDGEPTERRSMGFIADHWLDVVPEIVTTEMDINEIPGGLEQFMVMDYGAVSAITFQALKEYITRTDARIAELEARLAA